MTAGADEPILMALIGAERQSTKLLEAALAQTTPESLDSSDPVILALLGVASINRKLDRWITELSDTPTAAPPVWDGNTRLFR